MSEITTRQITSTDCAQVDALLSSPSTRFVLRIPWESELPETIAASLAPFREALERSYEPMTASLEMEAQGH